jgi:hypothetical protein
MLVGKIEPSHREVGDLPVRAVGPHHAAALVAGHAAAAHHVRADHARQQRLHRQGRDGLRARASRT